MNQMINLLKNIEKNNSIIHKRLDNIENRTIANITNNMTNSNNNSNNTTNNTFNIYFTADLDLYQLICDSKGEKFAQNYVHYAIHNRPYLENISEYVVNVDVDRSPIRAEKDGTMVFHKSEGVTENDTDGHLLEKYTKNIVQNACLKGFHRPDDATNIDKAREKSHQISKITDKCGKKGLSYEQKKEIDDCDDFIEGVYDSLLNGTDERPMMADLHKGLDKIKKSKITLKDKKEFIKSLPPAFKSRK